MKIEFPIACNQKCPKEKKNRFTVYKGSYIGVPKGTRLTIFVNENPDDPNSDVFQEEVIVTDSDEKLAILTEKIHVRVL